MVSKVVLANEQASMANKFYGLGKCYLSELKEEMIAHVELWESKQYILVICCSG